MRTVRLGLALFVLAGGAACARREPVGSLAIQPRELEVSLGRCAPLRFEFHPVAALDRVHGHPTVFVHFRAENDRLVSGLDHPLPAPWAPGVVQAYEVRVCPAALEPPLAPGRYRLAAGLYDDSWGYRWPLETGAEEVDRREYRLVSVVVAAAPPGD